MAISNNTIITSAGLDYVTSAGDAGPYVAVKYWLPVYDYRIDPNLHNGTYSQLYDLSAAVSEADIEPFGDIIYNIDNDGNSYSLSETDQLVLSAGGETLDDSGNPWLLSNAAISQNQSVNLYNGVPLNTVISGSDVQFNESNNRWEITDGVTVDGDNSVPTEVQSGRNRYFDVVDYYPVTDTDKVKGSFKIRLNKNIGKVKFNKIALYAVQVDSDGNETTGELKLFAQACVSEPLTKTTFGTDGFEEVVMDIQLSLASINDQTFEETFYGSSAEYWTTTLNGLYYSDRIGIGTYTDSYLSPQAKIDIKTSTEDDVAHIRLRTKENDYEYSEFKQVGDILKFLHSDIYEFDNTINCKAVIPLNDDSHNLGSYSKRWDQVYTKAISSYNGSDYDNITVAGALIPDYYSSSVKHDLGTDAKKWNKAYLYDLDVSNAANFATINSNVIYPKSGSSATLGSYSNSWKNFYIEKISMPSSVSAITITGSVEPLFGNQNIGGSSSNKRWDTGYFKNIDTETITASANISCDSLTANSITGVDFSDYVDLTSNQTISGFKSFTTGIAFSAEGINFTGYTFSQTPLSGKYTRINLLGTGYLVFFRLKIDANTTNVEVPSVFNISTTNIDAYVLKATYSNLSSGMTAKIDCTLPTKLSYGRSVNPTNFSDETPWEIGTSGYEELKVTINAGERILRFSNTFSNDVEICGQLMVLS